MTLANGRELLAIPGPSVVPDRVLRAMHRAAPNIYDGEITEMVPGVVRDLKAVARTRGEAAIYIANGHGMWEAALANTCSRGDRVLALATGRFGHGWAGAARRMGIEVEVLDFGESPVDPGRVEDALRCDEGATVRAVLAVQVDTATSVLSDLAAIREAMDAAGHPALLMADCIASLGVDRLEMDDWGVDVAITGSQKGLMTPPGMGFAFVGERADAAREAADLATGYWDWRPRIRPKGFYEYFNGTAPTHHLYGLREALDMIVHEEGVEAVWRRHERLASAVWAAGEAWAAGGAMALVVPDRAHRSRAVTSFRMERAAELRAWTQERAGVTLGIGLADPGAARPAMFRIGHMGHLNAHMVMGALGAIDAGLRALGLPTGDGALDAAAQVVAGA